MLYLLDANVLIDANRDYYPVDRVPEFWEWLAVRAEEGRVRVPREVLEEVMAGRADDLTRWVNDTPALCLEEEARPDLVSRVVSAGYAPDLTDEEVEKIGNDPFLIACGLAAVGARCVVTTETSKPSTRRANRRIPDVCAGFSIPCFNTFELTRALDFTTRRYR